MVKAFLFDLDDTLLDRKKSIIVFANKFYNKFDLSKLIDYNKYLDYFIKLDNNGYTPRNEFFDNLLLKINCNHLLINELLKYWFKEFPKCALPMNNLYLLFNFLKAKKIKIGIITNGNKKLQRGKIKKLKIKKFLDIILISSELNLSKPNKEIFQHALKKLNLKKDEAYFIGDNPETDIIGAYKSGITPIWFSNNTSWDSKGKEPKYKINDLFECATFVNK